MKIFDTITKTLGFGAKKDAKKITEEPVKETVVKKYLCLGARFLDRVTWTVAEHMVDHWYSFQPYEEDGKKWICIRPLDEGAQECRILCDKVHITITYVKGAKLIDVCAAPDIALRFREYTETVKESVAKEEVAEKYICLSAPLGMDTHMVNRRYIFQPCKEVDLNWIYMWSLDEGEFGSSHIMCDKLKIEMEYVNNVKFITVDEGTGRIFKFREYTDGGERT